MYKLANGEVISTKESNALSLGEKQEIFSLMIASLITWAYTAGYKVRIGDFFRDPRVFGALGETKGYGHPNSGHKNKLAGDLNLFKDGVYLADTESHTPLGLKWESMGGSWGGRFKDGNHYSLEHKGVR